MNRRNWVGLSPSAAAAPPDKRKTARAAKKGPQLENSLCHAGASPGRVAGLASCPFGSFFISVPPPFLGAGNTSTRSRLDEAELSSVAWMPLCLSEVRESERYTVGDLPVGALDSIEKQSPHGSIKVLQHKAHVGAAG